MKQDITIGHQGPQRLDTALPGDKSISHRALIVSSVADGVSHIRNLLESDDCLRTLSIFRSLGVRIQKLASSEYRVSGRGLYSLKKPSRVLDCGNSGTTMRLLAGLLCAQKFDSVLTGDASLRRRPMDRVIVPLSRMGARIKAEGPQQTAPLEIKRRPHLKAIRYRLPVASAQVKSAVLLAGLYASGTTVVVEKQATRNHTEIFLRNTGVPLEKRGNEIRVSGGKSPLPFSAEIPGDISSAAFLIAMGILVPASDVCVRNVLWNPTRTGFIRVLKRMGARLEILRFHDLSIEWAADIRVRSSPLRSTRIPREETPSVIDELPILMVLATQARGTTWIFGAEELRVKETDRLSSMVDQLRKMGARIGTKGNNIWVQGPTPLKARPIESFGDHRTAMSFMVAGMIADGTTQVRDVGNIKTSFPDFFRLLRNSGCAFRLRTRTR